MKKLLSILLAAVMALSLAACGGNQNSGSSSSGQPATKAAETKVESNTASSAANTGSRVLVLYFSAANTKDVDAVTTATPMVNGTSSVKWMADIIHNEVGATLSRLSRQRIIRLNMMPWRTRQRRRLTITRVLLLRR